ncbi:hypothetical protein DJ588_00310 [Listeria monocytogenes]|uniref:hypothetical protein n=1 Tax=Listeria welshimeri TaxID=1643 RepID=UPI0012F04DD7|nr:hypothetical protein [Listeria welshimeri]EAF2506805.1 hypothetical protein [Listeria monocytogenes]EAF5455170.1 hypothetical protein [Listeria monocytogenes]EAG5891314.1 hypothetical protein [Listeria monocytogenes]ECR4414489.1 hypothetical protein [Listeria monocytogenes]EHF6377861.1 hypothetical protein [Listeria monocytogenes]
MIALFVLAGLFIFIGIMFLAASQLPGIALVEFAFAALFILLALRIKRKKGTYVKFDTKTIPENSPQIKLNFGLAQQDLGFQIKSAAGTTYNMIQLIPSNKIIFLSKNGLVTNDEFYFVDYKWLGATYNTHTKTNSKAGKTIVGGVVGGLVGGGAGTVVGAVAGSSGKTNSTSTQIENKSKAILYFYNKTKDIDLVTELNITSKDIVKLERFVKYVK